MNILNARYNANDAIIRGKQRALEAREEGIDEGNTAMLLLAAQGQDISGMNAQDVESSYETIGIYNGLQEEINGIREALGYDMQIAEINYELDAREMQRDNTILASAINFGVTAAGNNQGTL